MACSTDCKGSPRIPHSSWTVDKLKEFLKEKGLSTTGKKSELVRRVSDFIETEELESELGAVAFSDLLVEKPIAFEELPSSNWSKTGLPEVSEERVCTYLKRMGAYTKNYRTGVRLCQCGHVYDVQSTCLGRVIFVRAKCRPTMRTNPPFYKCFVRISNSLQNGGSVVLPGCRIDGGNCRCPAGETQSCVHISALLFTLAEVTPIACTSLPCAWSRPSRRGMAMTAVELDFGKASTEGYTTPVGPPLDPSKLLNECSKAGILTGAGIYFDQEEERHRIASSSVKDDIPAPLLVDPLDKLSQKDLQHVTVTDLVEALAVTTNEIALIQSITVGQRDNPLWMDARQWRITASNFGRVCNRQREPGYYPPSLLKLIIGDYGQPVSAALEWGSSHEDIAIQTYEQKTGQTVYPCGFFISDSHPFLGASPDGVVFAWC